MHLAGSLNIVFTNGGSGEMVAKPSLAVKVTISDDGTVTFQRILNGNPIGGLPPKKFKATCVDDDLLTGISGTQVVTVGVARMPEVPIPL